MIRQFTGNPWKKLSGLRKKDNFYRFNKNRENMPTQFSCTICGSGCYQVNQLFLLSLANCYTYHCKGCGVYFRNPLPDEESVKAYYKSHNFRYSDEIEQEMARVQGTWIINTLRREGVNINTVRYIEFGAGRGWLISFMQYEGDVTEAIGFEPDRMSVKWGVENLHIDIREGFLADNLELDDINADVITIFSLAHVLEHLHVPGRVLDAIRIQYPSSFVFLEVPNAEFEGPVMELDTLPWSSIGQHFWSFTEQSLRILLEKSGYSVVSCTKDGKPEFWDSKLKLLRIWGDLSNLYGDWYMKGFSIKKGSLRFLKLAYLCLRYGVDSRLQKLERNSYDRLDLPVIRILAKAV